MNNTTNPTLINSKLCTHIIIIDACFINNNSSILFPSTDVIQSFVNLKLTNPQLKILITLRPENKLMSKLVSNEKLMDKMVSDVVNYLKNYNIDGFDYDWEFPTWSIDGNINDRQHFSVLLKKTSIAFNQEQQFFLFVTVASPYNIVDVAYDIESLNKYADYVQIMNYDFHTYSKFFPFTGINAPLRAEPFEFSLFKRLNSEYSTRHWIKIGLKHSKLVFGIPTYGRGYKLERADVHSEYAPACGISKFGEFINYNITCFLLKNNSHVVDNWSEKAASPYLYLNKDWISYENEKSVRLKTFFALYEINAAGIMVFSLNMDDFNGDCMPLNKYPLTNAIKKEINIVKLLKNIFLYNKT